MRLNKTFQQVFLHPHAKCPTEWLQSISYLRKVFLGVCSWPPSCCMVTHAPPWPHHFQNASDVTVTSTMACVVNLLQTFSNNGTPIQYSAFHFRRKPQGKTPVRPRDSESWSHGNWSCENWSCDIESLKYGDYFCYHIYVWKQCSALCPTFHFVCVTSQLLIQLQRSCLEYTSCRLLNWEYINLPTKFFNLSKKTKCVSTLSPLLFHVCDLWS